MKKIIKFKEAFEYSDSLTYSPSPASSEVPEWYRKQSLFSNGEQSVIKAIKKSRHDATYKACIPLVDSVTSGYMIKLPADILIYNKNTEEYNPIIEWKTSWDLLDSQPSGSLGNYPVPFGHCNKLFRWHTDWIIETPKDYSLWVTHPSHRFDLPFITINGFVDTDLHPNRLLLPFFIREGFEGIVEKGTPIAQVIPVKRDPWESKKEIFNKKNLYALDLVRTKYFRSYKNMFWNKKSYK